MKVHSPLDDELQKPTTNQLIRLIRRTFTCLGVGLVLLGTDSRIANMLDTRGDNSESRTTTYPCCFVIKKYPNVPESYFEGIEDERLKKILMNSRPLFGLYARNAILSNPKITLDQV